MRLSASHSVTVSLSLSLSLTPLPSFGSLSLPLSLAFVSIAVRYKSITTIGALPQIHTEIFFNDCPVLRPCNMREMLEKHWKANRYLHIGHGKAMFIDFGLAKERGGCCYLRYDDTNPEVEKKEYIDHIEEIVRWMGWEPFESEPTQAAIANGVASMAAAVCSQAVFVPIDVVSQKLMVQGYSGHATYNGGLDVARKVLKVDGIRGLYRGFGLSVLTYSPSSAVWWASYGSSQRLIWK